MRDTKKHYDEKFFTRKKPTNLNSNIFFEDKDLSF